AYQKQKCRVGLRRSETGYAISTRSRSLSTRGGSQLARLAAMSPATSARVFARKLAEPAGRLGLVSALMTLPWLHVPTSDARAIRLGLEPRICVRPPYFALKDLQIEGLDLHATATAESPAFGEVGPMPAAELGRHAAILGLSAAA